MTHADEYRAAIAHPQIPPAWAAYQACSEDHRRLLWVLSVCYQGISEGWWSGLVNRLQWRTQKGGEPLENLVGSELVSQLVKQHIIVNHDGQLRCAPGLVEMVTRDAVAAGGFHQIAALCHQLAITDRAIFKQGLLDGAHLARRIRLALYGGHEAEALSLLGLRARNRKLNALDAARPLMDICTQPFDPEWFASLHERLKFEVLAPLLNEAAHYLGDANATWDLAWGQLASSRDPQIRQWLAQQWLYRGQPDLAEPLVTDTASPQALAYLGWTRFLQGRNSEALDCFQQSLEFARRESRKRNLYVGDFAGVCFVLALLRADDPSMLEEAQRQVAMAIKLASDDYFEPVYRMLDDVVTVFRGEMQLESSVWLGREPLAVEPYLDLLRVLARRWLGGEALPKQAARLPAYCKAAQQGGWGWYAVESTRLLQAMEFGEQECSPIHDLPNVHSITNLVRAQEPWERALMALRGVTEGAVETASEPDQRLVWRLEMVDEDYCTLDPKEQKRSKRGGWTKGRSIALERLYEGGAELDFLTPQDRSMCKAIRSEVVYEHYGRYPKAVFQLDMDPALRAAVGHPLLFWVDDLDHPLELLAEEPALEIRKDQGELQLLLQPHPTSGRDITLIREGPRRLKLVTFSSEHRRIAEILGAGGLNVPASAKDKVLDSITNIAPLLNIHSDIDMGTSAAQQQEADSKPHIHLKPSGDGFSLECYIQPFGERGPVFRPGEGRARVFTEISGQPLQTLRDLNAELAAADAILRACPHLDPDSDWSWVINEPEPALDTLLTLQEMGDDISLEWPQGRKVRLTSALGVGSMSLVVRQQRDWFGIDGELRIDEHRVLSMKELLDLMDSSKGRYLRIAEDQFLTLTKELRKRMESMRDLADGGQFHPLAIQAMQEITSGMELETTQAWRDQLTRLEEVRELHPEPPSTLQAELRDYQLEGFRWLARLSHWGAGACLADDMGLGKTLQALALILTRAPLGPTLVLAPTSVCTNWLEEAARFAPTLRVCRFGPGDRAKMIAELAPYDLMVASYGLMQAESERLGEVEWASIVADEAQAIKNTLTKRSRAAMSLKAGFRMITTGTPIENHLGELWNLFRFINPGLLGSLDRFNQRFATPIEQTNDLSAKQRLKQLIRPFILRRLKSDVLSELPERTEITIHVELSDEEMTFYQALRMQALDRMKSANMSSSQQRVQILAEITRLRQACCNPRLVLPESSIASAKLQAFGEILEELLENRHKALVFSQFVGHLKLLREHLDKKGIFYQYLDGSTPIKKRSEAVSAFQRGEGELFLISLKAGGAGLNLTAADYVIHMDPWWNPAVEDQASDRAHRIGQQRPVTVYRLVAKNTIEDNIVKLHAHKRDLADNLLEGSDMSGRMTLDDMMNLLQENSGD